MIANQRQSVARFEPEVTQMNPAAQRAAAQQEKRREWEHTYDPAHK
jgi:hypothetical protein